MPSGDLVRFHLDEPVIGDSSSVYAIPFSGWVLTQGAPAERLELHRDGVFLDYIPVGTERRDIAKLFPGIPWAGRTGFRSHVSVLPLPPEFELTVGAVLEDGNRVWVSSLKGRRH